MTTRRFVPFFAILSCGAALAACNDEPEDPPASTPPVTSGPIACRASLAPGTIDYSLDANGRMLMLASGTPEAKSVPRIGTATNMIYGSWLFQEVFTPVQLRVELQFETGRINLLAKCTARGKTVTATATSPATITDRQFTVLQPSSAVVYIP